MRKTEADYKTLNDTYADCTVKVSKKRYIEITKLFFQFIMKKVLSGELVKLPARMGELEVIGRKVKPILSENGEIKGLAPDWVGTKKLWDSDPIAKKEKKILYHFNEHSNGIRYKFFWNKFTMNVPFKLLYTFIPIREYKRSVWQSILNGEEFRIIKR